jgi:hypothetical protein
MTQYTTDDSKVFSLREDFSKLNLSRLFCPAGTVIEQRMREAAAQLGHRIVKEFPPQVIIHQDSDLIVYGLDVVVMTKNEHEREREAARSAGFVAGYTKGNEDALRRVHKQLDAVFLQGD